MTIEGNLNREVKPIFYGYLEDIISLNAGYLNSEIYLNSNSLKAIRQFVNKLFNDGILLWPIDKKKTEFDIYRFFKAYKIIGKGEPFSSN